MKMILCAHLYKSYFARKMRHNLLIVIWVPPLSSIVILPPRAHQPVIIIYVKLFYLANPILFIIRNMDVPLEISRRYFKFKFFFKEHPESMYKMILAGIALVN